MYTEIYLSYCLTAIRNEDEVLVGHRKKTEVIITFMNICPTLSYTLQTNDWALYTYAKMKIYFIARSVFLSLFIHSFFLFF